MKRLYTEGSGFYTAADDTRPSTLRARIKAMPPLEPGTLYANQIEAVTNLEQSLKRNRPRAPLKAAVDAHVLDTSALDIEGGVKAAIAIVEAVRASQIK